MKTSIRASAKPKAKPAIEAGKKGRGASTPSARGKRARKSPTSVAIATELAPAVAIALLDKSDQPPGAPPPALDALAAGVSPSEVDGMVRVQLMFENGAVLPVEMTVAAGAALSQGLADEIPKAK